jgi:hypothetical protein
MYRVNAERSQEKNDRNRRTQRSTKVTCATRMQKKFASHRESHTLVLLFRCFRRNRSLSNNPVRQRQGLVSRTFAMFAAIYN